MSNQEYEYVVLSEQDFDSNGDVYHFIRWQGNEEELKFLASQLEQIDWDNEIVDVFFVIDIENRVNEKGAKQMCKLELNEYYHRKFDGTLKHIDFGFKSSDNMKKKMKRVVAKLGQSKIDRFIDNEDVSTHSSDMEDSEEDNTHTGDESDESEPEEEKKKPKSKANKLPASVIDGIKKQQRK